MGFQGALRVNTQGTWFPDHHPSFLAGTETDETEYCRSKSSGTCFGSTRFMPSYARHEAIFLTTRLSKIATSLSLLAMTLLARISHQAALYPDKALVSLKKILMIKIQCVFQACLSRFRLVFASVGLSTCYSGQRKIYAAWRGCFCFDTRYKAKQGQSSAANEFVTENPGCRIEIGKTVSDEQLSTLKVLQSDKSPRIGFLCPHRPPESSSQQIQVALTFSLPHRLQRKRLTSLPCFTSNCFSLTISHL